MKYLYFFYKKLQIMTLSVCYTVTGDKFVYICRKEREMCFLCGYRIFNGTMDEVIKKVISTNDKIHIVSGNPEVLYNGLYNKVIYNNFTSKNSVIIPDGIGVVKPLRLKGHSIQKIAGIDLFMELLNKLDDKESVYFLGASDEVLNRLVKNVQKKYKNVNIAGYHHGYIDIDKCDYIINDIKAKQPTIIFVAMGAPKQEIFITKYMNELPCKIFMGVGGSFDVISETTKRAPLWIINNNLEWLYRILKEPIRIKRFKKNINFVLMCIKDIYISNKEDLSLSKNT